MSFIKGVAAFVILIAVALGGSLFISKAFDRAEAKRRALAEKSAAEKQRALAEGDRRRAEADRRRAKAEREEREHRARVAREEMLVERDRRRQAEKLAAMPELIVHGRSGAPVGGAYKIRVTVKNTGGSKATGVKVRVKLISATGDEIETVEASGPSAIESHGRGKFTASYDGRFLDLIGDFEASVSFDEGEH